MTVRFREAIRTDVPDVLRLLKDDTLGASRESAELNEYLNAFDALQSEGNNHLIIGEAGGTLVATYQLTFISGLSLHAARRAQIESVRVASDHRAQGIGEAMIADAEARARVAGCTLLQLTMNKSREAAHRFYERAGFVPSHTGFKRDLT